MFSYEDFSVRLQRWESRLYQRLGRKADGVTLSIDRLSDPSLKSRLVRAAHDSSSRWQADFDDTRRKSANLRKLKMGELLQTERAYVNDLKQCIDVYVKVGTPPVASSSCRRARRAPVRSSSR